MYKNLKAEMARYGFTIEMLSKKVGVSSVTMNRKLNGIRDFYLSEALMIKGAFDEVGANFTLEYLFFTADSDISE